MLFPVRLVNVETFRDWECFDADTGKDTAREIRKYFIPDFASGKTTMHIEMHSDGCCGTYRPLPLKADMGARRTHNPSDQGNSRKKKRSLLQELRPIYDNGNGLVSCFWQRQIQNEPLAVTRHIVLTKPARRQLGLK